jgi:hypothetical protein
MPVMTSPSAGLSSFIPQLHVSTFGLMLPPKAFSFLYLIQPLSTVHAILSRLSRPRRGSFILPISIPSPAKCNFLLTFRAPLCN